MAVSEIKTMLQSARKYPQQNPEPYRNQPINFLCKSIDWFPHNTILCQKHLQADLNQKFQGIKKKKKNRKPLVSPESYSEPPEKSHTVPFSKKQSTPQNRIQKAPSQMPNQALNTPPLKIVFFNFIEIVKIKSQ